MLSTFENVRNYLLDNEVIMTAHGATNGSHEHAISGQESQQTSSISDYLPWIRDDTEDGDD
jgi:hypothetical protein